MSNSYARRELIKAGVITPRLPAPVEGELFFDLCNKPGRITRGTQEDFEAEVESGYAPYFISRESAEAALADRNEPAEFYDRLVG